VTVQDQDLWVQVSQKCLNLAQGLVTETRWMKLLPEDNKGPQSIRWRTSVGVEFNPHFKTPYPIHQAAAKDQLLAAQNLTHLFAIITRDVEAAKAKNVADAETLELTRLVLSDALKT